MSDMNDFLKTLESEHSLIDFSEWKSVCIDVQNQTYEINYLEPIVDGGRIVTGLKVWWEK